MKSLPTKALLFVALILLFANIAIVILEPMVSVPDLSGQMASPWSVKRAVIFSLVFFMTAFGFMGGLLVALIPYKKLSWSEKYLPASLLSIVGLHVFIMAREILYILSL